MANKYLEKIAERVHPIDEAGAVAGGVLTSLGAADIARGLGLKRTSPLMLAPIMGGAIAGSYMGHKATKHARNKLTDYLVKTRD